MQNNVHNRFNTQSQKYVNNPEIIIQEILYLLRVPNSVYHGQPVIRYVFPNLHIESFWTFHWHLCGQVPRIMRPS